MILNFYRNIQIIKLVPSKWKNSHCSRQNFHDFLMIYDSIQHHRTRQWIFKSESECFMIRTEQILRRSIENWANLLHLRGNCEFFSFSRTENILNTHRVCELLTDFTWTDDMLDDNKVRTRQTNLRPTLFYTQSAPKLPFDAEIS